MVEAFEDLALDSITLRPMIYPHKLFGRFYEITTLQRLLEVPLPVCPFTRKPFNVVDIEKPNMFERQFFDVANNIVKVTDDEANILKEGYVLFCRGHGWDLEAAEIGDMESMVPAALYLMAKNRYGEAKTWATKAARHGIMFGNDALGHIAMLEKDFAGAHDHFVQCWAAPDWNTKDRTAYFIAECYFEREMHSHALRWVHRSIDLVPNCDAITLCGQIYYMNNKFCKCIRMTERAKSRNMLAAFLYAMCQLRQVGKFKGNQKAVCEGSESMHRLRAEGYIEAGRFLTDRLVFDTVRNARRDAFRPYDV